MSIDFKNDKIGSLWNKTSKKGTEFMSGMIGGQEVVCFSNKKKDLKSPDWTCYKASKPVKQNPKDQEEIPF